MPAVEPTKSASVEHVRRALGVRDDLDARVQRPISAQLLGGEALVHLTRALPQDDLDVRLGRDPTAEVLIRAGRSRGPTPSDSTTWTALPDVQQMSDSALTSAEVFTYVTTGTPGYRSFRSRTSAPVIASASEQPAFMIGNKDGLLLVHDLRRLGHEVHTGHDDDFGLRLRGHTGQGERVALEVGDAVEDVRRHVVMRQNRRLAT